ncbi:hypothetical protein D8I24_5045 [Cupriavidus necator H850]|nr:hypothetical protein D8I24_5045 [Cupriavidus necator H850]
MAGAYKERIKIPAISMRTRTKAHFFWPLAIVMGAAGG